MSKQIDLTQPLSDEDREWLLARGRASDVAQAEAHAAALESGDVAEASAASDAPDGENAPAAADSYSEWKKAQLQSELEDRGLSPRGTVDELVARLRENDAEVNANG